MPELPRCSLPHCHQNAAVETLASKLAAHWTAREPVFVIA
jgi:hypothetical protein